MKPKQILTSLLLLFVVASLAAAVFKQFKNHSSNTATLKGDKIVVYYFHGNKRCKTCNRMERFTHEVLQDKFTQQIKDGTVELKLVNLDESGNEHFVSDYAMEFRVVVLSKLAGGKEVKWTRLDKVWDLAHDEPAFKEYIQSGLESFMKGEG